MTTRRWTTGLTDAIQLLGMVMILPVAILLVGAPVALTIAALLWIARLLGAGL